MFSTSRASKLCKTCKVVHFEPAVYKRWLSLYSGTGKLGEQVVRWQAVVDKHTRKPKNTLNAE